MHRTEFFRAGRARTLPAVCALGLLSACGAGDNDLGPGGVTVGEARALDEAAAMLDEQRLPEQAVPAATTSSDTEQSTPAGEE